MHGGNSQPLKYVMGPTGTKITKADLPKRSTRRWVVRRKAEVVLAVRGGLLSREEACEMYDLSEEEYENWCDSIEKHGMKGLRITKIQKYR